MKILHTADWHLGHKFHGNNRQAEHDHFLQWLLETLAEEQPDVLIVAGDVFDNANPSAEAEARFYKFLYDAGLLVQGIQIIVTAGNHDSAGRIEAPSVLMRGQRIYLRGIVEREGNAPDGLIGYKKLLVPLRDIQTDEVKALGLMVPFLRMSDLPDGDTSSEGMRRFFAGLHEEADRSAYAGVPRIVIAHFYATGAELSPQDDAERYIIGGQEAIDVKSLGKGVSYVALGHIHKPMRIGGQEAYYAGSPIPMSFAEVGYQHGINKVILSADGGVQVSRLLYEPLRQLLRIPTKAVVNKAEALSLIDRLPDAQEGESTEAWPYLEIKIREDEPDFSLAGDIKMRLADKAVVFCRVQRDLAVAENATTHEVVSTLDRFTQAAPVEMLKVIYENRYKTEVPEKLIALFREAEQAAEEEHNIE